jgi:signal transduction histidine kinase
MNTRYCFIALLLFSGSILRPLQGRGQDSLTNHYTDISKIKLVQSISRNVSSAYISKKEDAASRYNHISFTPGLIHQRGLPKEYVARKALLRFHICNTADTSVAVYFFPGYYYEDIILYQAIAGQLQKIPRVVPPIPDSIGYRLIQLPAGDSATLLAEIVPVKTYINTIRPRLINPGFVDSFIAGVRSNHNDDNLVTFVFCGLLLMMILFSLANYLQGANKEFLYYSGYAFFLGAMLFTKAMYNFHSTRINFFLEGYLDFILQALGIVFYMVFMQRFLNTRNHHPFLHRLYNAGIIMLLFSVLAYTLLHYFTDNYPMEYGVELVTKILLLLMMVIFLVYSLRRWKDKLLRFLFWGNLFLFIFSIISQVFSISRPNIPGIPEIFNSALFHYELGLFLELVLFLMGLNYKNRRQLIEQTKEREALKAENKLKEYEKEIAVYKAQQEERERISADMHDELGSGMTAIRLMSEIARNKMKENTPAEIDKISSSADDVLNKMNAIIWSMNSGNDTLDNLVSYIRSYALEYFDSTPVQCRVTTPEQIPAREITGDKRRNVFLCVKETLHNALKHSQASLITIDIDTADGLLIRIHDNGKGIDLDKLRQFGNGLKNINRRMESIGGRFSIENNKGTLTTLQLPL